MADLTLKRGDTFPALRGQASDQNGLMDLTEAESLKFIMKKGATVIEGTAEVIDPPDEDEMNWKYKWAEGDTAVSGSYQGELEITWDSGTTPPEIETIPNEDYVEVVIEDDLG